MLRQLYQQTTGSLNGPGGVSLLPGGAGVQVAGNVSNPGISAPYIEDYILEVFDVTAPTLINTVTGNTPGTPAIAGKLLVLDPANSGPGGWKWKQNSVKNQAMGDGTYGIVYKPASATVSGTFANGSTSVGSASGNIASPGDKALVVVNGPTPAFLTSIVNTTAISAGMPLASDGAGNLTYAGAAPAAGTVLATAMDSLSGSISTPALRNVYLGGF